MILRDYQTRAIDALRDAYRSGRRAPLLVLPTGGGKTAIIAHVAASQRAPQTRVLVLVHRVELLRQCSDTLMRSGVEHATLGAGQRFTAARVVVASVQTIARRSDLGGWEPEIVIIDEGHHATAATWGGILERFPRARVLGVTATPCRTDGRGLGDVYDALVLGPSVRELVDGGYLSPCRVYAPPRVAELASLRARAGDYTGATLDAVMDRPTVTGDAVEHYRRLLDGKPAIAFCSSVAHAAHVAEAFRQAGYRAESVDGSLDGETRRERIEALGSGALDVLTSCEIISEGTDVPVVVGALLLRPTMSTGLYLQQVGRVMRPARGKLEAVVVDHVGSVLRHGMPDDVREWTLEGGIARRAAEARELVPVTCPTCYCQIPRPLPPRCPHCATETPVPESRQVDERAGELVEVTREQIKAAREAEARMRRAEERACRSLEDLERLGRERGYKPGWARHRWENSRRWA